MTDNPVVYVVDDDASFRKAVSPIRSAGFAVESLASAEEFLERPVEDRPSCLVLDVRMPGSSGMDLAGPALQEARRDIPIVFMTGHGDVPTGVRAMKGGAVDFLEKPVRARTSSPACSAAWPAASRDVRGAICPFGKYDQLFVPEFNAGAMENAGAVTFREEYVFRSRVTRYLYERRCETILHEMAHMWFGDLVTMRWWDDLWLNESFATWASVVAQVGATEYTSAWTTFANVEKSWAYVQDQLPSTHPIAADMVDLAAVEVNFDGITYAKGASVLKQLAAYVGYEQFLSGLRAYFAAHAFGNATLEDLLSALEETSGRDLHAWAASWLQTTGLNTLSAEIDTDDAGVITRFEVLQSGATPGAGELRPHRLAIGLYDRDASGALVRTDRIELDVLEERTAVPGLVGRPRGALALLNDDDLTYCKARLDPASLSTAIDGIAAVTESLPRTLLWSAVWEMTRDARMRARDFVTLAVRGMASEDQVGVLQRVLAQLQVAVGAYADPAWAAATGWPVVSVALHDLALAAAPGSDTQLAAVQAFALGEAEFRTAGGDRRLAGRLGAAGWTGRRHRPVLDPAGCPCRAWRGRHRGDR